MDAAGWGATEAESAQSAALFPLAFLPLPFSSLIWLGQRSIWMDVEQ